MTMRPRGSRHLSTRALHLAIGWPLIAAAACAMPVATRSAGAQAQAQGTPDIVISRSNARPPRIAPRENFTGIVRVLPLFDTTATTRASGSSVSFEAGARTAWHAHPRG